MTELVIDIYEIGSAKSSIMSGLLFIGFFCCVVIVFSADKTFIHCLTVSVGGERSVGFRWSRQHRWVLN